jgi:hypothetical protein
MGAYYAYRSLFDTKSFMNQYGIDVTAMLPARLAGSLIASITIVGVYILFRENGPEGTWPFFAINFLQALIFSIFGYLSVNDQDIKELDDVKYTAEAYVVPLILAILNAVLIYGLSDKIYL